MNLNSILFPAPKSSYSIESLKGELIWIPKFKKCVNSQSTSTSSLLSVKTRSLSSVSYNTPMLKSKQNISVASPLYKLKSKDVEGEESPSKKSPKKMQQIKTKIQLYSKPKSETKKNDILIKKKIPSLKLDLFELVNRSNSCAKSKEDESSTIDDFREQINVNSTSRKLNSQATKNTSKDLPAKHLKYKSVIQIQVKQVNKVQFNGGNPSQTNFDVNHIDEYENVQQQYTPRTMFKYSTKEFCNPNIKVKQTKFMNDSQAQPLPSTKLKKAFYGSISLCPLSPESDITQAVQIQRPYFISPRRELKLSSFFTERQHHVERNMESPHAKFQEKAEYYIPCLLLLPVTGSDNVVIYFHGNGEDINLSYDLLSHLRDNLNVNVIAIEYPGYGLYKGSPDDTTIMQDSEAVYGFLTDKLNVKPKNILLFGRSIGSGPATYLASQKEIGALILMSAFTSIRAVVKDLAGKWAQYLIKERFNNLETISKVKCPTFFIHGQKDKLIPYNHSENLHSVCTGASELILPKEMDHIEFDFFEDFSRPLIRFLQRCGIEVGVLSKKMIYFPAALFIPPDEILNSNQKVKDDFRKRDRSTFAKSYDTRIITDANMLSPKGTKRSVIEF